MSQDGAVDTESSWNDLELFRRAFDLPDFECRSFGPLDLIPSTRIVEEPPPAEKVVPFNRKIDEQPPMIDGDHVVEAVSGVERDIPLSAVFAAIAAAQDTATTPLFRNPIRSSRSDQELRTAHA